MKSLKITFVILALVLAELTFAGPAVAAPAESPAGAPDGEVLCVQVEDSRGRPVGPKVCIPWFLPIP